MPPISPTTQALLIINLVVFCLQLIVPSQTVDIWFGLWSISSGNFMPWQLLTYAFLHASFGHLFFNSIGLWMFGSELESIWGRKRYIQYYAASVLVGGLCNLLMGMIIPEGYYTVGASGGLFGLLLAYAMMFPNRIIMPILPPIPLKAKYYVMIFGGLELFFGLTGFNSGIAHFAHLGGMLGGWLMFRYWRRQPPFGRGGPRRL